MEWNEEAAAAWRQLHDITKSDLTFFEQVFSFFFPSTSGRYLYYNLIFFSLCLQWHSSRRYCTPAPRCGFYDGKHYKVFSAWRISVRRQQRAWRGTNSTFIFRYFLSIMEDLYEVANGAKASERGLLEPKVLTGKTWVCTCEDCFKTPMQDWWTMDAKRVDFGCQWSAWQSQAIML